MRNKESFHFLLRHYKPALFAITIGLSASSLIAQRPVREIRTGSYQGQPITFEVVDGWAVVEGDIRLARVPRGSEKFGVSIPPSQSSLWPKQGTIYQVPYTNANGNTAVTEAVKRFNATFAGALQYIPRDTQADYVQFILIENGSNGCGSSSNVGRVGGAQTIDGKGGADVCVPVMMHEMGHAVGLFHEHQRSDRDGFVKVQFGNIQNSNRGNYDRSLGTKDIGLYDLGSTMHYGAGTFAADPSDVTMESIPVGIPFREGGGYSAADIDALLRLYGAAPRTVTVTSNPVGLQLTVDDTIVTTGTAAAMNTFAGGSAHTLDVPDSLKVQTLNGVSYLFGRWNDVTPEQPVRHTITVASGDGSSLYPASSPNTTVYAANFRQLVPVNSLVTAVNPPDGGRVLLSPDPVNIQNQSFYFLNQPLSAIGTAASGYNFYDWQDDAGGPGAGANPRTVRPGIVSSLTARFSKSPVISVKTDPAGLAISVDTTNFGVTKNFSQDYDASWTQGSSHSVSVASPQPSNTVDTSARLAFSGWSDNGTQTHNITVGQSTALTASFVPQYPLRIARASYNGDSCPPASVTSAPVAADSFYNAGTQVRVSVQPATGWIFVGWQGDLSGNANPATVTMDRTRTILPVLNTAADALTIVSLSPAAAPLNTTGVLTVTGTGFTAATTYCFFDENTSSSKVCGTVSTGDSKQVTIPLTPDVVNRVQTLGLSVYNSPDNQCSVVAQTSLPVR